MRVPVASRIQERIDQTLEHAASGPGRPAQLTQGLADLDGKAFVRRALALVSAQPPDGKKVKRYAAYLEQGTSKEFLLWFLAAAEIGENDAVAPAWLAVFTHDIYFGLSVAELLSQTGPLFLELAYRRLLGRAPDPGAAAWARELKAGCRREIVLYLILRSQEARARQCPPRGSEALRAWVAGHASVPEMLLAEGRDFLEFCYRRLLGRRPDRGGAAHWARVLREGCRKEFVLWRILCSEEAQERGGFPEGSETLEPWVWAHASVPELLLLDGREFVELCYRRLLGRPPDPDGVGHWAGLLQEGCRKELVLWLLLTSPEVQARGCRPHGTAALAAWVWAHATLPEPVRTDRQEQPPGLLPADGLAPPRRSRAAFRWRGALRRLLARRKAGCAGPANRRGGP